MSDRPSDNLGRLDIDLARRIDEVCRTFEADWRAGSRPRLDDYLSGVAEDGRAALRAELVALEHELRQAVETGARPGPAPTTEAPTLVPPSPPTALVTGLANPSVHEDATVAPRQQATVDLGTSKPARPDASEPVRVRYFGDYEIERELARGGMGVVFRARQISLNRPVALKMILAGQLADDTDVKRFYTEAEAAANLDHPGIVPVYEVGQHEGQHYFSMGFIEGQSLAQRLADGPLPPREAAELMAKVAEAIEYAHRRGVIHRDLKPGNILLDPNGHPRVTDFGLAKKLETDSGLTGSGQIMGTPSYMPPEQAGGNRGEVGPAADVYALGATLYALLTGRPPFQAATPMDTVIQVISDEPVPPRWLNASIPLDLETIALKCLQKEPLRRYATAADLAADLGRYLSGEPIAARPVSPTERAWKWMKRRRALSTAIAACVLALLVAAVGGTWFSLRLRSANQEILGVNRNLKDANDQITRTNSDLKTALEDARRQRDLARGNLYVADMALAQAAWDQARIPSFRALVAKYASPAIGERDLRGFEWSYFEQLGRENSVAIRGLGVNRTIAYSRDGRQIAIWPYGRPVQIYDAATLSPRRELKGGPGYGEVAFSPDGRLIAAGGEDRQVRLYDAASGELVRTLGEPRRGPVIGLAFHPDGKRLVECARDDDAISTWLVESGRFESAIRTRFQISPGSLAFSPDGRHLAVSDPAIRPGQFQLRDARTGKIEYEKRGAGVCFAFSPDGRMIAAAGDDGRILIWETARGTEIRALIGHAGFVAAVAFRPDGRELASVGEDTTVRLWDTASGRQVANLKGHTSGVYAVAYRPDGQRLATSDWQEGVLRIWDPEAGQECRTFRPHRLSWEFTVAMAFDSEGRRIASASGNRTVKVLDSRTGAVLLDLDAGDRAHGVAFHPDGSRLAAAVDMAIRIWDSRTGKPIRTISSRYDCRGVAYSPDGRWIVSAPSFSPRDDFPPGSGVNIYNQAPKQPQYGDLTVWDAESGQVHRALRGHYNGVQDVAFSADGRTLVSSGRDLKIRSWDLPSGRETRSRDVAFGTPYFGLDPRGRRLAFVGKDKRVHLQDLDGGQEVLSFTPHCPLHWLVFSPDGRRLAVGGQSSAVKFWDLSTGQEILTLEGKAGQVHALAFDPGGRRVATSHFDGHLSALKVWPAGGSDAP
jgi:WD40 repeat protein